MPEYVLGMDPGAASGFAVYDLDTCTVVGGQESRNGVTGFVDMFLQLHEKYLPHHLVCEDFSLRPSNKFTADLSGVHSIGWLRGEGYIVAYPQPAQHMTLTRLREKADKGKVSPATALLKSAKLPIGAGHVRMGLSTALWYAAKILNHRPTLELLQPREV